MKKTFYTFTITLFSYFYGASQCSPILPLTSASSPSACVGNTVTLNNTTSGSLGGASYFQWAKNGVPFGPTAAFAFSLPSPTITVGTNIFHIVAGGGTCTGIATGANTSVVTGITPTLSVSGGTICSGNSFTINPTGASTYTYSGGSNVVSPPVGTSVYTVTGAISSCTQTKTLSLVVNLTPTISAAPSATICSGNWYQFLATGSTSYTFASASSTVFATTANTFFSTTNTVTPTSNITYTITSSNAGCAATNTIITNITVNPTPTITASNGTICAGNTFTLNPSGATSYTYSGGSAVVSPTVTSVYLITGNSTGCNSSKQVTVTVNPLPNTYLSSNYQSGICPGSIVSIGAFGFNPSYMHTMNGMPAGLDLVAYNYTLTAPNVPIQTYTFVVTNTVTGCSKTLTTFTASIKNGTLTGATSNSIICPGQSAVLTGTALSGSVPMINPNWIPVATSYGYSVSISPTVTTTYTFQTTDASGYGCIYQSTFTQSVGICTDINETLTNNSLLIYPNPANEVITIDITENKAQSISITNTLGEILLTEKINSSLFSINISALNSGVYFIKLENSKDFITKKFIKQ